MVAYGVWGPVLQAPVRGRLTIVVSLPLLLLLRRTPPSPADGIPSHPCRLSLSTRDYVRVRAVTVQGPPLPLPHTPFPPPSYNPAPATPLSTRRSGDGQRRQQVVNPVKTMAAPVYFPKNPGVYEGDLIEVPDIAGEG